MNKNIQEAFDRISRNLGLIDTIHEIQRLQAVEVVLTVNPSRDPHELLHEVIQMAGNSSYGNELEAQAVSEQLKVYNDLAGFENPKDEAIRRIKELAAKYPAEILPLDLEVLRAKNVQALYDKVAEQQFGTGRTLN